PCVTEPLAAIARECAWALPSMRVSSCTVGKPYCARAWLSSRSSALPNGPRTLLGAASAGTAVGSSAANAHASAISGRSALFQEGRNAVDQIGAVEPGPVPRVLDEHELTHRQL